MLLDVGVGFSPPVGVLRHFVQSEVVNQEVGVGFRTHDDDLSVASFCNTQHYCDFRLLLLLLLSQCSFCVAVITMLIQKARIKTHNF